MAGGKIKSRSRIVIIGGLYYLILSRLIFTDLNEIFTNREGVDGQRPDEFSEQLNFN